MQPINQIWIHIPFQRVDKDKNKMTTVQSVIEKKTMVNLVRLTRTYILTPLIQP